MTTDNLRQRVARAIDPEGWRLRDTKTFPFDHPAALAVVRQSLEQADAVLAEINPADIWDEGWRSGSNDQIYAETHDRWAPDTANPEVNARKFAWERARRFNRAPFIQVLALITEVRSLRDRLAAVEAALADHPRACDRDDDPIACGWKRAVPVDALRAALETDTTKEN